MRAMPRARTANKGRRGSPRMKQARVDVRGRRSLEVRRASIRVACWPRAEAAWLSGDDPPPEETPAQARQATRRVWSNSGTDLMHARRRLRYPSLLSLSSKARS